MGFLWYLSGYMVIIVAATVAVLAGANSSVTAAIGWGGVVGYQLLTVLWIVVWDSRKKWPSSGPFSRLANLLSFQRSE